MVVFILNFKFRAPPFPLKKIIIFENVVIVVQCSVVILKESQTY